MEGPRAGSQCIYSSYLGSVGKSLAGAEGGVIFQAWADPGTGAQKPGGHRDPSHFQL